MNHQNFERTLQSLPGQLGEDYVCLRIGIISQSLTGLDAEVETCRPQKAAWTLPLIVWFQRRTLEGRYTIPSRHLPVPILQYKHLRDGVKNERIFF